MDKNPQIFEKFNASCCLKWNFTPNLIPRVIEKVILNPPLKFAGFQLEQVLICMFSASNWLVLWDWGVRWHFISVIRCGPTCHFLVRCDNFLHLDHQWMIVVPSHLSVQCIHPWVTREMQQRHYFWRREVNCGWVLKTLSLFWLKIKSSLGIPEISGKILLWVVFT